MKMFSFLLTQYNALQYG